MVPMPDSLYEILQGHQHLKGSLVFSRADGTHLTRDVVKHPFERVMRAAGLHRPGRAVLDVSRHPAGGCGR